MQIGAATADAGPAKPFYRQLYFQVLMAIALGMGMGDVKLGTALALATATLGWGAPLAGLAASVVVGGVAGTVALTVGRRSLAFGPWLLVGHALAAAWAVAGDL